VVAGLGSVPESFCPPLFGRLHGMIPSVYAFRTIRLLAGTRPENGSSRSNSAIELQDSFIDPSMPDWDDPVPTRPAPCFKHRGEIPCTRRYCSCHPPWAGTSPQGRPRPPPVALALLRRPPVAIPVAITTGSACLIASTPATPPGAAAVASPRLIVAPRPRLPFLCRLQSPRPAVAAALPLPRPVVMPAAPAVITAAPVAVIIAAGRRTAVPQVLVPRRARHPACRRRSSCRQPRRRRRKCPSPRIS
jgi:hypothetical protein